MKEKSIKGGRYPWKVSFRDPAGKLFVIDDRIIRLVNGASASDISTFLNTKTAKAFVENKKLIFTKILENAEGKSLLRQAEFNDSLDDEIGGLIAEHEKVQFLSFPYEWVPEMLHEAGQLTLDLAEASLAEGFGLKDATPYNILFRGPEPVFVDILSFERRDPGDLTWLPYAQFMSSFLLPLLVNKHFGIPLDVIFTVRRNGLEPEEVYKLCGGFRRLLPPFLTQVSIPTWLTAGRNDTQRKIYERKSVSNTEKARFVMKSLFRRLRRQLAKLAPKDTKKSVWSDYTSDKSSQDDFIEKRKFVEGAVAEFSPKIALDVGCNTGYFSNIVAKGGAKVVAIDSDPVVVSETWENARNANLDILPLVIDITRPSPNIGWHNRECPSFLDRACGSFDMVLMLAVIHHMIVSERIPLSEVIDLAAELTNNHLIIEFIPPDDPLFSKITRGRDHLFTDLTRELFEDISSRHFEIIRSERLGQTKRWLYLMRKKGG